MHRPIRNPQPVLRSFAEDGSAIRNRSPSFFWQGALILLPVLVLAVVGLVSLRQDEQSAEQAARKRAAEDVQSLARAINDKAGRDIHQFLSLQKQTAVVPNSIGEIETAGFSNVALNPDLAKWEREYPSLHVAALAAPDCILMSDGREITPADVPVSPSPPKWFCELSAKQRQLWDALCDNQSATQAFLDTNPDEEARQAALAFHRPPELNLHLSHLPPMETGVFFEDVACCQLLKSGTPLSALVGRPTAIPLLEEVWHGLFDRPSFLAPVLLKMVEERTNGADPSLQEKVRLMRRLWDSQCAVRACLEPLRKPSELSSYSITSWSAHWSRTSSGCALGIFQPNRFVNLSGSTDGVPPSGQGWIIAFIPEAVLEATISRALAESRYLIPDFAAAAVSVEGKALAIEGGESRMEERSFLVGATQEFGTSFDRQNAASLAVAFYLTSREKMLATEQHRVRLFGALIGAAALAALGGLLAARRAFYEQHRLSEMKTNFVSSVSHELRAPIASIRLLAEGLERGKIAEAGKKQEYYHFLVQESRRLTSLIENVLDFSRIDQGRKDYRFEPTDLEAVVDQTIKLMHPGAEEKQVELIWRRNSGNVARASSPASSGGVPPPDRDVHPPCEPPVESGPVRCCDGLAIQQALINLIDNAIKHSPASAKVTVGLNANADWVQLWVEDHGPGIPAEEHEKIFERFYRRGSELRRETQGIGIGLSIVKHIVEAHGGRVLLRSALGQGSRFTIELPSPLPHKCGVPTASGTPPLGGCGPRSET